MIEHSHLKVFFFLFWGARRGLLSGDACLRCWRSRTFIQSATIRPELHGLSEIPTLTVVLVRGIISAREEGPSG